MLQVARQGEILAFPRVNHVCLPPGFRHTNDAPVGLSKERKKPDLLTLLLSFSLTPGSVRDYVCEAFAEDAGLRRETGAPDMRKTLMTILILGGVTAAGFSAVFPPPQQSRTTSEVFSLSDACIAIPDPPPAEDLILARSLSAFLVDRYQLALPVVPYSQIPSDRPAIVLGTRNNKLVGQALEKLRIEMSDRAGGPEGYVLQAGANLVLVAGGDNAGAFYGLQSLRQLVRRSSGRVEISGVAIRDWPYKPFRGIKVYLPGRDNLPFFKRFLRDFVALYKFNKLILEMNAGMRFDRHPELNAGWIELANDLNYSRRHRPEGPNQYFTNSVHHDTADGRMLEKDEVADLVRFAGEHYIEVIPEVPSLTHSYYLLTRHRELAEIQESEWPDTYCPSNQGSYDLLFDVVDEFLDVMKPKMMHMGLDEWRMPVGVCPLCRGKDPRDLFISNVNRVHQHLRSKGVRMAMWGDHFNERVRGVKVQAKKSPSGYEYETPGALTAEQVKSRIPKDILVFNWLWEDMHGGAKNDADLTEWGFEHIYGNFTPEITNYGERSKLRGLLGGAPSCWAVSSEFSIGKDRLHQFLGTAALLWSSQWPPLSELYRSVQTLMPELRRNLSGKDAPSQDGDPTTPIRLPGSGDPGIKNIISWKAGRIESAGRVFELTASILSPFGGKGTVIPVGEDFTSLIFLHALQKRAHNNVVDRYIYNPDDTADLLGFYEVVYTDGLKVTIPIRYRVNILQWDWAKDPEEGYYCYGADAIDISQKSDSSCTF
ncbi:MAG: hypothetical protein EHM61_25295, partial [Acidobacteria bacterium]